MHSKTHSKHKKGSKKLNKTEKNIGTNNPKKLSSGSKSKTSATINSNDFFVGSDNPIAASTNKNVDFLPDIIPTENATLISEEIYPNDNVTTFYNRVQNFVFEKWNEDPSSKFVLIIYSKIQELDDSQLKIISDQIPPNYSIPLVCQPIFITIGAENLPPIKTTKLIDGGFYRAECVSGIQKIHNSEILTVYDERKFYFKRMDDPNSKKIHSYILTSLYYKSINTTSFSEDYNKEWEQLNSKGMIKDGNLTEDGFFAANFEDFLFYEYVIMISYMKIQDEKNKISAFLFSLLILQIIRFGDDLIFDHYSENLIENFDQRSDLVTFIKVFFPFLKFDQNGQPDGSLNEREKYISNGLNPSECEIVVNFIMTNFRIYINYFTDANDDDDEDRLYNLYCEEIDKLQVFLTDLYSKINELIKVIEINLPEFYKQHLYSFIGIERDPKIVMNLKDSEDNAAVLFNRPGWHCYSFPSSVFVFSITRYENTKPVRINLSFVHSIDEKMEINTIQIPEELDNVFARSIINSIVDRSIFIQFFTLANGKIDDTFTYITTIKSNKSFISYCPKNDHVKKCKNEINNVLNLVKLINPFLPNSLLIFNKKLSIIIELQMSGLSTIHSRVYSAVSQSNKKSKGKLDSDEINNIEENDFNYPFYNAPRVYNINKKSLAFLVDNIDEMKGFSPSLRIALTANDFMNFGESSEINKRSFSIPSIDSKSKSKSEVSSHLFILSDAKRNELGSRIKFADCQESSIPNIYQTISLTLPEFCKVSSDSYMVIVQKKDSTVSVAFENEEDKKLIKKILKKNLGNNFIASSNKNKNVSILKIPLTQFLENLESEFSNNIEQFPQNIQFNAYSADKNKITFLSGDLINKELKMPPKNQVELVLIGDGELGPRSGDMIFLKLPKNLNDGNFSQFQNKIHEAIRSAMGKIGEVEISPLYNLITFSFQANESEKYDLKRKCQVITSQIIPKISPFMFNVHSIDADDVEDPATRFVKFDLFSEKVAIETANLIAERFEGEKMTKVLEIEYPHPLLKDHKRTQEAIDNWVIVNNSSLQKVGSEWVGSLAAVDDLLIQFKRDLGNKVFHFDYRPYFFPFTKFKDLRESFEDSGFQDYDYNELYELIIIKPENYDKFDLYHKIYDFSEIDKREKKFCLRMCKGSIPYKKRLSVYDVDSENSNSVQISFCSRCASIYIKELTKKYFSQNDIMNDACQIVFPSRVEDKKIETGFRPFDFFSKADDDLSDLESKFSIPIGQLLWFFVEMSNDKLNQFIRAWVSMAADVAVHQCPMIVSCPNHLSRVVKIKKNSVENVNCPCGEKCQNYLHMKCLKWHNLPPNDVDENEIAINECGIESVGFKAVECPNCSIPTFNLFGNIVVFCDRCGCNWCYLCKEKIDEGKIVKHINDFHDGHYSV